MQHLDPQGDDECGHKADAFPLPVPTSIYYSEHPLIGLLKLCLFIWIVIYIDCFVFFFLVLLNLSMIRDSEMPFGTAASLEWLITCFV